VDKRRDIFAVARVEFVVLPAGGVLGIGTAKILETTELAAATAATETAPGLGVTVDSIDPTVIGVPSPVVI
jgi:hypothetical protein